MDIVSVLDAGSMAVEEYFYALHTHGLLSARINDVSRPGITDAIELIRRNSNRMYMVFNVSGDIVGEVTVESFTGSSAVCHFSANPCLSIDDGTMYGRTCVGYLLTNRLSGFDHVISSLVGIIPVNNRTASRYVHRIGFDFVGILKHGARFNGKLADATINVASL